MVVIAEEPIACPVVSRPSSVIVMNKASLEKFAPRLQNGGLMILNSSLISGEPEVGADTEVAPVPMDDIAGELGSPKSANMVGLGAYLAKRGLLGPEDAAKALPDVLAKRYHSTLPVNIEALKRGAEFTKAYTG
jgi:2-oxoglutarate ferredoxin oxidoreductase subunit gamma